MNIKNRSIPYPKNYEIPFFQVLNNPFAYKIPRDRLSCKNKSNTLQVSDVGIWSHMPPWSDPVVISASIPF